MYKKFFRILFKREDLYLFHVSINCQSRVSLRRSVQSMQCHSNLNSVKMSHLPGQTRLLEDIAVDTFLHSSFGAVVAHLHLLGLWLGLGQ
jgi:hypothetical protein